MSAQTSTAAAPLATPLPRARHGSLRLVPQRRSSAARAPFVALVVGLLVVGLLGLLVLNTVLAQDAFRLHDLDVQGRQLDDTEQQLLGSVQALQAPQALAARAHALGMVPAGPPAFLRLSDGAVLGAAAAGAATGKPATGKPATGKPAAGKPAPPNPAPSKAAAPKPTAPQPPTATPSGQQPRIRAAGTAGAVRWTATRTGATR